MDQGVYMLKRNDLLLVGILLAAAAAWWGTGWWLGRDATASQIQIWQNKVLTGAYPLDSPEPVTIPLGSSLGYNQVVIENGAARMVSASCPDQVCVQTAPIRLPGQTIVCLPNRVVVEVTGEKESEIDELSQ